MRVSTPKMKGFESKSKFTERPEQSISSEQSTGPEFVKQPFPVKQFLLACVCVVLGAVSFWYLSSIASVDPDPLELSDSGLNFASINQVIERNAPLRLPTINSQSKIKSVAAFFDNLAIRFEDNSEVVLTKNTDINQTNEPYTTEALNAESIRFQTIQLPFTADQGPLKNNQTSQLDSVVEQISDAENTAVFSINIYAFDNIDTPAEQATQLSLSAAISDVKRKFDVTREFDVKRIIKQPLRAVASITQGLSATTHLSTSSPFKFTISVSENATEEKKSPDSPNTEIEQKIAPAPQYNEVSNTLLLSQVNNVAEYLVRELQSKGNNAQVRPQTVIRNNVRSELEKGVVIEVSRSLPTLQWQEYDANATVLETIRNQQNGIRFQIVNKDVINLVNEDSTIRTIAVLPSALSRYYDENLNYRDLKPMSYPSILSLLAMLIGICGALYVLAYRQETPDADIIKKQLLVDSFVSDAPASNLSQDKLGFTEISTALSRFLRNAGTKAPLTLAITGAWGTGKSSLMYFLKENLLSFHMQPVWVNAWHHQNEEQFLAGLLSSIRRHAIPPFWTTAGLLYRWNLLKTRWHEAPFFYYSFAFIFLASLTFILAQKTILPANSDAFTFASLPFISALLAAIPILNAGMDKISRLSKTSLIQTLIKGGKQSLDLRANVGLREKFASEFGLLCTALGDSTLTIFIDDLDRCKEARIMDVMETINYLVSSGDCFIVIAMERDPVEKAIEAYYKATYSDLDASKLKSKARRYLEKIINIEIPVPNANEEQFNALVKVKDIKAKQSKLKWLKQFALAASLLASIFFGNYLASVMDVIGTEQNKELEDLTIVVPDTNVTPIPSTPNEDPSLFINYTASENNSQYVMIPIALIIGLGMLIRIERYRQRKRIVETDSEPFLEAISIWARVMGMSNKTPRSIKRFVNRTRFLAMRNAESDTNIREENLVTLAALIDIAKDKGLTNLDQIEEHLPPINNPELKQQVKIFIQKCDGIDAEKRSHLQRWIRGFNVS